MTPRESFTAASDSAVAKGCIALIAAIGVSLGGWSFKATLTNASDIRSEAMARVEADSDMHGRLVRIETNTERILERLGAWGGPGP